MQFPGSNLAGGRSLGDETDPYGARPALSRPRVHDQERP